MNTKIWILLLFAFQLCLVNLGVAQTTYYVSNSGNDSNDGLSWATAKATINGAMGLITAPNNDSVFVAVGTYPACTIQNGTHVYGGFVGTESHLYERQPLTYGISADNTCTVIDANNSSSNAVVINRYLYYNSTYYKRRTDFDGFFVTGATQYGIKSEANATHNISNCTITANACGMYMSLPSSSSTSSSGSCTFLVTGCKISQNTSSGGVYMNNNNDSYMSNFNFDHCVITENSGNIYGGMMFDKYSFQATSIIVLNDCDVTKNTASGVNAKAGGILTDKRDYDYNMTKDEWHIINSRIIDNTVYSTATTASADNNWPYIAGGISNYTTNAHIIGCVIANNSAISTEGISVTGGVASYANGTTTGSNVTGNPVGRLFITNCVIANNLAQTTSGVGGIRTTRAATIKNTVMWKNMRGNSSSNTNYSTSYTQPYTYCACTDVAATSVFAEESTNILLDSVNLPRFVAPSSMVGATTIATDMSNINADWRILPNSPLVDAGDPNTTFITYLPETDMDGNPRIYNNIADIGAFECTQTTMSQTITWNQSLAGELGDTIKLTATASSGLPVSYSSSNESVAHISNDTLFVVGAGTSIIIASQAGNHLYLPASDVSQTINISTPMLSQTIAWNQNLNFNIDEESVELTAVASSGLPVSYTSSDENIATISGNVLTFVGVGQAIITASQAGNENFSPAADVMRILTITEATRVDQTIEWNQALDFNINEESVELTAVASSGLPVSYTCSNENVATVSGNVLTFVGVGQAIITASQDGNENFYPAADVMRILTVAEASRADQIIEWNQDLDINISEESVELTAVASSGLPVSYTCSNENVATVSGNVLTFVGVGQAIITASQDGNENFYPAADVMRILTVTEATRAEQTIEWNQDLDFNLSEESVELTAVASSGLPVSYTCSDESVATVSGNVLTFVGVGQAIITASQAGNENFSPAADVMRILTVTEATRIDQTIEWNQDLDFNINDESVVLTAVASSSLPVSYTSSDESVATVSGNVLTFVGVGQAIITASQAGNENFSPAADVMRILTITEATRVDQTIEWNQALDFNINEESVELTAEATSGLPVSYTSSDENIATISGNVLTFVGVGQAIITASQAGNENFSPAADVMRILTITEATRVDQTIEWNQALDFNINEESVELTAEATSGLPVSYTSSDENIATISGNVLTFVGVGQAIITASQAGNENFNPAADVMRILNVFNNVDVSDAEIANVSVYPNPTEGEIHIESQVIIETVSIYNVYGQLISSEAVNGSLYTANISDNVDGVYVMRIMLNDGKTITHKVVKQQ